MERLRVSGAQVLAGNQPIRLRGINRSGMEYSRTTIPAGDLEQIASWGANFVRVPFNQQWVLEFDEYVEQLATVAALAAERNLYVLFDLQWLAYGQQRGADNATPPLPDADTPAAWKKMAQRFADNPAVMFDLLNEPHDRLPGDPFPLFSADNTLLGSFKVTTAEWHPWAQKLSAVIRESAPDTLLFLSGVDWGYQCSALEIANVIYAAHVYLYSDRRTPADWDRAFGQLAVDHPVVVTELGPDKDGRLDGVAALLDYLDARGLGWAAWSWTDAPHLIGPDGNPTPFGQLVHARIK
jgi:hypothetical protein